MTSSMAPTPTARLAQHDNRGRSSTVQSLDAEPQHTSRVNKIDHIHIEDIYGSRIKTFQKLMKFKIRDILLVSSLYDSYLFEEDGRLYDQIREEFQTLSLSHPPEITHISSGQEAIELAAAGEHFDLIITTLHIEEMHVVRFAKSVREAGITTPIVVLAYDNQERKELEANYDTSIFQKIFIWQGDYRLLIAIIKYVEDLLNVENDTITVGVRSIILVEDNVKFYSSYLPLIYTEILEQSQRLISEGINVTHKLLRMRARPKILLCSTYEEAWAYYQKYEDFILGIISDINFKRDGVKDPEAGFEFVRRVHERQADIPILLQSSNAEFRERAKHIGASFVLKTSPRLHHELRKFMVKHFGFGDFVFRTDDGAEVGRAHDLRSLEEQLHTAPEESIRFHAERNHFSNWLKARTEFWLAHKLRPRKVSDFASVADLRNELLQSLRFYREMRQRGVITEFNKDTFDPKNSFARIGGGSLGGKARGLGFINTLISNYDIRDRFAGVEISVPSAVVIATDAFDEFLRENDLETFALNTSDDEELKRRFLKANKFPREIIKRLSEFLSIITEPLAVRSSSLLEDSQYQPFAGVYQTFMIPNNNADKRVRLQELLESIKLVYASTFSRKVKDYMKATAYRLEEEKMAVIVQRMVGAEHHGRFYPDFAGVAKSYNFYPVPPQSSTDGIVLAALGLGKTVVDGGNAVRFCPKYPRHLLQFFSTKETLRNAQQDFFALNLSLGCNDQITPEKFVEKYDMSIAEKDQTLFYVGSTYSQENDTVYDGISRDGKRVVTFSPILKHHIYPLPEILELILEMGTWGMGTHVEIEFAANMDIPPAKPKEFAMLQIRPMVLSREIEELDVNNVQPEDVVCESTQVLGNGITRNVFDLVVVDIQKFERSKSRDVARELDEINAKLLIERRPYVLIGVGRWGSLDPWLGIPVTWDQISGACVIVESGFRDIHVAPSQGSHFFQNITSFRVGYFTVNPFAELGRIDWGWLDQQLAIEAKQYTRHLRFSEPMIVRINGHKNKGVILKPGRT
jgi:CheY-like chemotaxis protein